MREGRETLPHFLKTRPAFPAGARGGWYLIRSTSIFPTLKCFFSLSLFLYILIIIRSCLNNAQRSAIYRTISWVNVLYMIHYFLATARKAKVRHSIRKIINQSVSRSLLFFTGLFTPPTPIYRKWGKFPNSLWLREPGNRGRLFYQW